MLETILDPQSLSPDLIYIALVTGLWIAITAAYVPGTGIAEVASFILLFIATITLAVMPTNWIAVILIVVGVIGFLTIPFFKPEWSKFAEVALIPQIVGGLFLFSEGSVSIITIAVLAGVAVIYHRFVLLPVMRLQQDKDNDPIDMIGYTGRVTHTLNPTGMVHVNGEMWSARSDHQIEVDSEIIVVEQHGLELIVEKAKRDMA